METIHLFPLYVLLGLVVLTVYYFFSIRFFYKALKKVPSDFEYRLFDILGANGFLIILLSPCNLYWESYNQYFYLFATGILGVVVAAVFVWLLHSYSISFRYLVDYGLIFVSWLYVWILSLGFFFFWANDSFNRGSFEKTTAIVGFTERYNRASITYYLDYQPFSLDDNQINAYKQPQLPSATQLVVDVLPYLSGMKWLNYNLNQEVNSNAIVTESDFNLAKSKSCVLTFNVYIGYYGLAYTDRSKYELVKE